MIASSLSHPTVTISTPTLSMRTGDSMTTSAVATSSSFQSGQTTISVSSTSGFTVGQVITDTTNSGAIAANTTITAVGSGTLTLSSPTQSASFRDNMKAAAVTFSAVFSTSSVTLTVSSISGLNVGQYITDTTTSGNLAANTYITAIGSGTITINQPTLGASASSPGDTMSTQVVSFNASYLSGGTSLLVNSVNNLYVGQVISDTTNPQNITSGTTIATINPATNTITISSPALASVSDTLSGGAALSVTLYVPTLRLTYKVAPNPVRIVGYRWSVGQPVYYQFTSLLNPTINNPAVDLVTITDTLSDAQILGNTILYTTGGVVENIAPPASIASALFNNRLFIIDAEDQNLLWFSKQVIEDTPVDMSDLLTIYVAPTSGAQGSTGFMTALSAMDDKLIIFKKDAIYYINGVGPDNTGANSGYSDPIFISSAVGCANPNSIVLMPNGLMFQSDKGIWLLGRDLNTTYIGAPVEAYNSQTVMSAQAIPGTNQVRFVLSNNVTLVYDYYFNQWSTFTNIFAIYATLYKGLHTYLNSYGQVLQETPGFYLDGSSPVLMSILTGWINVAGLQGFERFYQMLLLGTYYTPFTLNVSLAYNYNSSAVQQTQVLPNNYTAAWGNEAVWGSGGPWGGNGNVFETRVFPQQQKCESFQVGIQEIYDSTYKPNAGQGLTLSGINLLVGVKKGTRTQNAGQSFG